MPREAVAIVTGGSFESGRSVARGLAGWDWAIVVVYLEHQWTVEATIAEILGADGQIVAVRADLADELDVERLFAESRAAFGDVDVVVHTVAVSAPLLYRHAAQHVNPGGVIVTVPGGEGPVADELRERAITFETAPWYGLLPYLDAWRRR